MTIPQLSIAEVFAHTVDQRPASNMSHWDMSHYVPDRNIFLNKFEVSITVDSFETFSRRTGVTSQKFAFLNIYKNNHVDWSEPIADTIAGIRTLIYELRSKHDVRNFIIAGDFNCTDKGIDRKIGNDFYEHSHKSWSHKHNKNTQARKIDRVFTNIKSFKILRIMDTAENKQDASCGHKIAFFSLGVEKTVTEATKIKYVSMKVLKNRLSELSTAEKSILEIKPELATCELAENLIKFCSTLIDSCTRERRKGKNEKSSLAFKALTDSADQLNSPDVAKRFYKFYDFFKAGVDDNAGKKEPTLEQHRAKQEDKLFKLNVPDKTITMSEIDEIYKNDEKVNLPKITRSAFQEIIMTASNSGAKDVHGQSLKLVKQILKCCPQAVTLLYEIFNRICAEGSIPDCLKVDIINLLYKNKGSYADAKNWRPITIAPSLGKMIDKVLYHYINFTDDKNVENHAYIANRSCMSAILKVQEFFKNARNMADDDPDHLYIPVILTEDISSAFESLPEELIVRIIQHCFECSEIKLDEVISSYLNRCSYVVDNKDRKKKLKIRKRYINRSSPQGSVLSPKFWRFFDKVFSHHYKKSLNFLVEKSNNLALSAHCSYADDHLTCILLRFSLDTTKSRICKTISTVAKILRKCLDFSTRSTGCGINPDKSEIVCATHLTSKSDSDTFVEESKDEFIWLGYSLGIKCRYNSFFLDFTKLKIDSKIASARKMIRDIFQYTYSIQIRHKIYQTYISPIIETFIPADMGHRSIYRSDLEKFNHWVLCLCLKVPITAGYEETYDGLGQKGYILRKTIIASRLYKFLSKDIVKFYSIGRTLRDGRKTFLFKNKPLERDDIFDRIYILKNSMPPTFDKPFHFNIAYATAKSKEINREISKKIKKRTANR